MFRVIHLSSRIRTFHKKCDNVYAIAIPILIKLVAVVCVSGRTYIANANSSYNTAAYVMRRTYNDKAYTSPQLFGQVFNFRIFIQFFIYEVKQP